MTGHAECKLRTELPKIFKVSRVAIEAKGHKSIFLSGTLDSKPGQFIMVWLPGVEEKPMAVSEVGAEEFAFCYHTLGPFTQACDKLKPGDKIGIRGPYGNGFGIREHAMVVGGGVGMSSVSTLIDALSNPLIINGARDKEHLLYLERFKGKQMTVCTDDGSAGKKEFTTDALKEALDANPNIRMVYTCGPELMMKKVVELCNERMVDCEASVERYMKCGFGVCGNCLIDDRIICTEGPVFSGLRLKEMQEFGTFARLKTGKKVPLSEYYGKA
ncbi:MAG: dihydroorotate dehydrogenase electron transfer subunit [Nanoarchaeota archaeon]|nr:dihydroorotate dehydrogenase electron transfer subunit [Nanoarchaeota archaeon]